MLRRNPHLRGTLADLPETAARARQHLAGLGLDGRCEVAGHSFFDPLPAGPDAYLLSQVIHDWDDASASAILRRCAEAAGSAGRVLVIESVAADGDPASFAEMNLRMLVLAGGGFTPLLSSRSDAIRAASNRLHQRLPGPRSSALACWSGHEHCCRTVGQPNAVPSCGSPPPSGRILS